MEKVVYNFVYNCVKIALYTFIMGIIIYCVKVIILKIDTCLCIYTCTHIKVILSNIHL